ncbi:MAG: alpha-hydroxy-acid oxidizing protein [Solirubrobacteraceae bacterium]
MRKRRCEPTWPTSKTCCAAKWAWAVAARGKAGVRHVLDVLRADIDIALALTGHTAITDLDGSVRYPSQPARTSPWRRRWTEGAGSWPRPSACGTRPAHGRAPGRDIATALDLKMPSLPSPTRTRR